MMNDHVHDWRPFPNWSGRYVCQECRALGYRKLVVEITTNPRENERIIAYACARPGCSKAATFRTKGQFCTEHEHERVQREAQKDALQKQQRQERLAKQRAKQALLDKKIDRAQGRA